MEIRLEQLVVRLEQKDDYKKVENLTREAFWDVYRPGCSEHLVLHKLRNAKSFISDLDYVFVVDKKIVANIVYTKMFDEKGEMLNDVIAFGPISVDPEYQKRGIGKKIIEISINRAKELGYKAVLITGNDKFYNPLGFEGAYNYGVTLPGMSVEDKAEFFMAMELEKGYLSKHSGVYNFDPLFNVTDEELEKFELEFPKKEKREPRDTDL
ncbi:N-acetyltransferase [Clostridium sp. 1001271B_151109_B4]|uniref:GNAT family N-acetyltransferase n=1 Tax=Clostridium sp. 1001271B_151109_B4 TaxID=2787148 RepID=UPI0018AA6E0B|nr:N-acetyltransferase [Clostridium sp. 1001271B_151109_B4]